MAVTIKVDAQQSGANWQHKISWVDIELKEKQFMYDEIEYYKEIKTKLKKYVYADDKKTKSFRWIVRASSGSPLQVAHHLGN